MLVKTGRTQVESLRGLHRAMPFICAVYTVGALALMGTPGLPGFVSKWMIGSAAIERGQVMGYVALAALLISAVLTAIYLMSVAFSMYFRPLEEGGGVSAGVRCDPSWKMKLPLLVLTAAILLCGLFSNPIVERLTAIAAGVL